VPRREHTSKALTGYGTRSQGISQGRFKSTKEAVL